MLSKGGTPLANQRRRWEFGRSALRSEMLGPLIRSPHLGWLHKAAAGWSLASPPTSHIVLVYLMLSGLAAFAIPGMIENGRFYAIASICALHFVATLALMIHALSPLDFTASVAVRTEPGVFPLLCLLEADGPVQGQPDRWIPTERECEKPVGDGKPDAASIAALVSDPVTARKQETN